MSRDVLPLALPVQTSLALSQAFRRAVPVSLGVALAIQMALPVRPSLKLALFVYPKMGSALEL